MEGILAIIGFLAILGVFSGNDRKRSGGSRVINGSPALIIMIKPPDPPESSGLS